MKTYTGTISTHPALKPLLTDVATARTRYLDVVLGLTDQQAQYKPSPDVWSAVEITEHLFWAEQGGIWGMWRALQSHRNGTPVWTGEHTNRGRSIEEIVGLTWQPKEQVPPIAAPRLGSAGVLVLFAAEFTAAVRILFFRRRKEDLEAIIHPHPISGPLDIRQRFEFLRFHLDRHRAQVEATVPKTRYYRT